MSALPFDLRFELGPQRVRLVHGSPRKVNEYLFEDKPARLYERLAREADCELLVFGHTHKPWIHDHVSDPQPHPYARAWRLSVQPPDRRRCAGSRR